MGLSMGQDEVSEVGMAGGSPTETANKYQIAGVDDRNRGFSRMAMVFHADGVFRASLRYEDTRLMTDAEETEDAALQQLIKRLHARGYTQLRTRLNFRGEAYLGSQEEWVDYPDPEPGGLRAWLGRLMTLFRREADER